MGHTNRAGQPYRGPSGGLLPSSALFPRWEGAAWRKRPLVYSRLAHRMLRVTNEPRRAGFSGSFDERLPPLSEVALAASALVELRHGRRNIGIETLHELIR